MRSILFDLRGYIVVRNAITTAQIDDLSTRLEMHRTEQNPLNWGRPVTV